MGSAPHSEREQVLEQGASPSVISHGLNPLLLCQVLNQLPHSLGWADTAHTWVLMAVGAQLLAK